MSRETADTARSARTRLPPICSFWRLSVAASDVSTDQPTSSSSWSATPLTSISTANGSSLLAAAAFCDDDVSSGPSRRLRLPVAAASSLALPSVFFFLGAGGYLMMYDASLCLVTRAP
eukprot:Amastigsp_a508472_1412.p5 type:complete len:118 gc:universal Amastigsp_a508472_1412:986-633(-)